MSWSFLDFTGLSHFFGRLPEKLVTTETTQTISGTKSFSSTILGSVSGSAASAAKDGSGNVIADTYATKTALSDARAEADAKYETQEDAATHLTKTEAASAYVQAGNANQTIGGTKTFSNPVVADITGNAATATQAASATKLAAKRTIALSGAATGTATDFDGTANIAIPVTSLDASKLTGTASVSTTGNAASATKLQTARSLWGNNFDGSQNLSGNIHFTNDDLTGVVVGAIGKVGNNDFWRVGGGATANDSGFMELATADNGDDPIYVRQYTGAYATITRTATLLDASGNTQFPGTVTATAFYGNITGNVTGNCSGSSGSCTGNAATATRADSAAKADTATNATNATNSNAANQLQAFVNDNFTSGNHYVKAIRSSQGWSTHLWMCYNNGAKMADEVSVNHANSAGVSTYAQRSTNNAGFFISNYYVTVG